MKRRRPDPRRGVVLVAVIVVLSAALLIASSMITRSTATRVALGGEQRRVQQRLAAWSGVRTVMARLAGDRDVILDGRAPLEPIEESVLWEAAGDEWLVRLLPVGPAGELVVSEAGKLDLSGVTADDLVATGVVDAADAAAVIAARDAAGGRLTSVAELAAVIDLDPESVLGPLEEIRTRSAGAGVEQDVADRVLDRLTAGRIEALVDLLTVHAVEPELQQDGTARIVIPATWSEELGQRLDDRFGDGVGAGIGTLVERGQRLDERSVIVQQLRSFDIPRERWPDFLDGLGTDASGEVVGRLDINRASLPALLALPGLDEDAARAIVDEREGLADDERWSITWPLDRDLVDEDTFQGLVDRITTRTFTWRIRVAVGRRGIDAPPDEPWRDVTVLEAVVDLAAPTPRLAELRDVTDLELAATLVLGLASEGGDERFDLEEAFAGDEAGADGEASSGPGFAEAPSFDDPFGLFSGDDGLGGLIDPPDGDAFDADDPPMSEAPSAEGGPGSDSAGPPQSASRRRGARWLGPG